MNKTKHMVEIIIKFAIVFCAALLMGFGISMYYVSGLGSDPISTFLEAVAVIIGVKSGTMSMLVNLLVVVIFFFFKKHLIGVGTFIQTFCVGLGINMGMSFWYGVLPQEVGLAANLVLSLTGAVLIGISLAMYLPCNVGASPTDIMVLTACDLIKKSYKWGFYTVYAIFLTAGILLGGVWGMGTVISMIFTGLVADLLMPKVKAIFAVWFDAGSAIEKAVQL